MNKIPRVTLRSQRGYCILTAHRKERVVVKTVYVDIPPQNMQSGCKGILRSLKTVVVFPLQDVFILTYNLDVALSTEP